MRHHFDNVRVAVAAFSQLDDRKLALARSQIACKSEDGIGPPIPRAGGAALCNLLRRQAQFGRSVGMFRNRIFAEIGLRNGQRDLLADLRR